MNSVIKRLVDAIKQEEEHISNEESDDYPIEYYELEEIAKHRVLMRSAFRSHFIIFVLLNIFMLLINFLAEPGIIESIYDVWILWPSFTWGLAVWIHFLVYKAQNIENYQIRVFTITALSIFYLIFYLIFLNYFSNYYIDQDFIWWPWTMGFLFVFIISYAYIVFFQSNDAKMKILIKKEIEKINADALIDENCEDKHIQTKNVKKKKRS